MKLIKIVVIAGLAGLLLVACTEKSSTTTGQVQQEESQTPSRAVASTEPAEIDGTLTQTEKGLAIVTDTDTYIVAGQDLSDMLGKKVIITGAISEAEDGQVIQVMSVIPMD